MISSTPRRFVVTFSLLLSLFALALADTPIIRMARISLIEGEVSYRRANQDDKAWFDADMNTPLGEKDQVFTGPRADRNSVDRTQCRSPGFRNQFQDFTIHHGGDADRFACW